MEFTVRYVPSGIEYRPGLQINTQINIGNNEFQSRYLLSIVRRSCDDSDKPGERCEVLQVTVNGTNMDISILEGRRLEFLVLGAEPLVPDATLRPITLRIVGKYQFICISHIYLLSHWYCTIPRKKGLSISAHVSFIGGVY